MQRQYAGCLVASPEGTEAEEPAGSGAGTPGQATSPPLPLRPTSDPTASKRSGLWQAAVDAAVGVAEDAARGVVAEAEPARRKLPIPGAAEELQVGATEN